MVHIGSKIRFNIRFFQKINSSFWSNFQLRKNFRILSWKIQILNFWRISFLDKFNFFFIKEFQRIYNLQNFGMKNSNSEFSTISHFFSMAGKFKFLIFKFFPHFFFIENRFFTHCEQNNQLIRRKQTADTKQKLSFLSILL